MQNDTVHFEEEEDEKQPVVSYEDEHEAFAARYIVKIISLLAFKKEILVI